MSGKELNGVYKGILSTHVRVEVSNFLKKALDRHRMFRFQRRMLSIPLECLRSYLNIWPNMKFLKSHTLDHFQQIPYNPFHYLLWSKFE
jgi:hypothetical protein